MPAISSGCACRLRAIRPCMWLAMGPSAGFMAVDRAGLHVVHDDATPPQIAREALGQAHDGGLAHAIDAEASPWHPVRVGAAMVMTRP